MTVFNIGDRIIKINDSFIGEKGIIIGLYEKRVEIKFNNMLNVRGSNLLFWCAIDDIELDKEWYREEKLKQLGI